MNKLGKYEIIEEISSGAMGIIYKARDPFLDRVVAIKTMKDTYINDDRMLERFKNEARAAAMLNHPNIITIYELGEEKGTFFIVMELLDGVDFKSYLEINPQLNLLDKIQIIKSVAEGLSYAHKKNIIHRDIKPANIMLLKNGTVKITDFGIAHLESSHITRTGMVVGTPDYMSPEQVLSKKIDQRSDIFSLGLILYQSITGKKAFNANSVSSVMYKIANTDPPTFEALNLKIPFEVETIVSRSMQKDPSKRYQIVDEMLDDLKTALRLLSSGQMDESIGSMAQVSFMVAEAQRLLGEERPEEARAALKKAEKLEPENTIIKKLIKKAETAILKEKNLRIRNIMLRAESAVINNDYDEALKIAHSTFNVIPNNPIAIDFIEKIKSKIHEKTGEPMEQIEIRIINMTEELQKISSEPPEEAFDATGTHGTEDFVTTDTRKALEALPKEVRMLIEDADRIYYQRKSIVEIVFSINKLMKASSASENNYEAIWRLSRNYYQKGMLITSISEQKRAFNQGITWGKRAGELESDRAEGFYWLAVNLAKWADVNGIFRGLVLIKKIHEALEKVIKYDDKYSGGGGYRVLGRIKFRMPSIVGGSINESLELFEKSLAIEPRHPDTLLFLAESLVALKKCDEAKKHLDTLLEMEPLPQWQFETRYNRKIAENLLSQIEKDKKNN